MKTTAAVNAPMQLRQEMHIGSFMDVIFLDLIKRFDSDTQIIIQWNALGKFRQKDGTSNAKDLKILFNKMRELIHNYYEQGDCIHFIDDDQKIYEHVLSIVSRMISKQIIKSKEYFAWYCETCDSYLGPIEQRLKLCKQCSKPLSQKRTTDLFISIDKLSIRKSAKNFTFIPEKMKKKFLSVFSEMPNEFIITKKRTKGFSAEVINKSLKEKVFDPKFVYSLFPTIATELGLPKIKTIILGEDILGRYLYYLLSHNQTVLDSKVKIIVHGMLTRAGKKISKYGNFPEITDINKFLEKYSWEHLKLLCVSSNIGQTIDFDQKIVEATKLITKKRNVIFFLEQTIAQDKLDEGNLSDTEVEIIDHCEDLIKKLSNLNLFDFYSGYRALWFDLLSRKYISEIRDNQGCKAGIKKITTLLPLIL